MGPALIRAYNPVANFGWSDDSVDATFKRYVCLSVPAGLGFFPFCVKANFSNPMCRALWFVRRKLRPWEKLGGKTSLAC